MGKLNKISILIVISIAIVILDYFQFLNFIKNPADQIIIPIKKEIFSTFTNIKNITNLLSSYSQVYKFYQNRDELVRKNEELQFKLNKLLSENLKLRTQLGAPFPANVQFVVGQVIALSRFMEIDIGSASGVKKGQVVVVGETLVGKVAEVAAYRSKVILTYDPDFKIAAVTNRGTRGEIAGQGSETILFTKVLKKDELFLQDLVTTAGEEFIPPNLLIGKVVHITSEEAATYKQAKVTPIINFDKEKTVFVITSL